MKVTLLSNTELSVCSHAIRTCWNSFDKSDNGGEKDRELIDRVGNKYKHSSTLEHLNYTFYIQGISRACLQELARHRMASLSVKSSRYTLKELKDLDPTTINYKNYLRMTGNYTVDNASKVALKNVILALKEGTSNDIVKYCLPESFLTDLTWTINARSLQNFLKLRTSKSALLEISQLAYAIHDALPRTHSYLFTDSIDLGIIS